VPNQPLRRLDPTLAGGERREPRIARPWHDDIIRRVIRQGAPPLLPPTLATDKELSDFLKSVEKRAFKRTAFAVRDDDSALDIVQDSMIRLAEKYTGSVARRCATPSSTIFRTSAAATTRTANSTSWRCWRASKGTLAPKVHQIPYRGIKSFN
jgi:hypothetical protein